jgi:SAM-dependent methyltransferase
VTNVDPKGRFSNRVDDYVRYRPGYPRAVVDRLRAEVGLGPGAVVADLGAGTGIFTAILLDAGARVLAVEPNAPMRAAAEARFAGDARFTSVDAGAEATTLPDESVDLVVAAQAFHWFDPARARVEALRILRRGGGAALVWNLRKSTPFLDAYDAMLRDLGTDYGRVKMGDESAIATFFGPTPPALAHFDNAQILDEPALRGRLLSASYTPKPGEARHDAMMGRLHEIFVEHAQGGVVTFDYDTRLYHGRIK